MVVSGLDTLWEHVTALLQARLHTAVHDTIFKKKQHT